MSRLTSKALKLLKEGGSLSSIRGFPSLFINGASHQECRKMGIERGFSVTVNGKPFSSRGDNAGRLRTRKLADCATAEEVGDMISEIAYEVRQSSELYGFNILLNTCPEDIADEDALPTELTREQASALIDQLYRRVYFSNELMRVSKGEWSDTIYRRPTDDE